MIGVGNHAVLTDPHFGVQALRGKFVRSCPPPPSLPASFAFRMKNSLGAFRYRGSGVAAFSALNGCVNMIQLFAVSKVGSDGPNLWRLANHAL